MVLVVFSSLTWLVMMLSIMLPSVLKKEEKAFLFCVIVLFICNGSWIFIEELKFIELASPLANYFSFLLFRTVIIPFSIMMGLSVWLSPISFFKKKRVTIILYCFLFLVEWASIKLHVYYYQKWNYLYSMFFYFFVQIISYFLLRWFRQFTCKEE